VLTDFRVTVANERGRSLFLQCIMYRRRFTIDYLCVLLVGDGVIRRPRLGKNVTAATNTGATLDKLLDASFSMRSVP
jgi:hypothetical protein